MFAIQIKALDKELGVYGNNKLMTAKAKSHSVMICMIISNYNKIIELVKKRQEKYLLIQSLHEIGNLYYSNGQLKNAETQWNNWVDIIFQKDIGTLRTYRKIFEETPNIAAVYGWMQWLIGGVVLAKLAKLWYNTNLHLQRECIIMGSELLAAPFRVIMLHPQEKIDFCEYRMKEFLPDIGLLSDKQALQSVDLLKDLI